MMMGTLNYMAPEQVRGERADHRSDIFSAGVVLYEVLGGRKAFEGDSFGATLYKILEEVPEPLPNIDDASPSGARGRRRARARKRPRTTLPAHERDAAGPDRYRQQLMLTNSPPLAGSSAGIVRGPGGAPSSPGSQGDQLRMPATPSGSGVNGGQSPELAHDAMTIAGVATPTPAATPGWGSASGSPARAVPLRGPDPGKLRPARTLARVPEPVRAPNRHRAWKPCRLPESARVPRARLCPEACPSRDPRFRRTSVRLSAFPRDRRRGRGPRRRARDLGDQP